MTALLLAAAVLPPAPAPVRAALEAALTRPDARVEIVRYRPAASCPALRARARGVLRRSGRVSLRVEGRVGGRPCTGFASAEVEVLAPVLVVRRAVARGAPVPPSAVTRVERPLGPGAAPPNLYLR